MTLKKFRTLIASFCSEGKLYKPIVVVFILINSIVLLNACLHDPSCGYDNPDHWYYIDILSNFRLPSPAESREFFCPPLPYIFPALVRSAGTTQWMALKCAQLFNVMLSLGLTYYLILIITLINPKKIFIRTVSLAFLGMLPVYYKTFVFVRGEPYVAFFSVFAVYYALMIFVKDVRTRKNICLLGIGIGLLMLSRQWGVLIVPAIIALVMCLSVYQRSRAKALIKTMAIILIVSFMVGGWFYMGLKNKYGSFTAFNLSPQPNFSFANQPIDFYFGIDLDKVFINPTRDLFQNHFVPIFYTDTWGDYWEYFTVKEFRDKGYGRMRHIIFERILGIPVPNCLAVDKDSIGNYLGRVNLLALLPTIIMFTGLFMGAKYMFHFFSHGSVGEDKIGLFFFFLIFVSSMAGYFWFLIMHPSIGRGDTIKSIYIIQIFPFIAILSGYVLQNLQQKAPVLCKAVLLLLIINFIHNLSVMISCFSW